MEELFGSNEVIERAVSYSRVSDFDRNGPHVLIKRTNPQGLGLKMGSIIDDLTLPKVGFNFEDEYLIFDGSKPTATLGKIVDIILENYTYVPSKQEVLKIIEVNKFWSNVKNPDILDGNYNTPDFWKYLAVNFDEKKRNIITTDEYNKALDISEVLKTHEYSTHIFNNSLENINQYKFQCEYNGLIFRGVIDKVLIDHENKSIQFIDLKTGQDKALSFKSSFIKYRYYLQEAVYMQAFDHIVGELGLEDYTCLPFMFLYVFKQLTIYI